jgi:hypothetical protein
MTIACQAREALGLVRKAAGGHNPLATRGPAAPSPSGNLTKMMQMHYG